MNVPLHSWSTLNYFLDAAGPRTKICPLCRGIGPSALRLRVGRALLAYIHRQLLVEGHFLDNDPQPPLETCLSAPKICSLEPIRRNNEGRKQSLCSKSP